MVRLVRFERGETFLRSGRRGDDFFILLSGQAEVRVDGRRLKVYSAYDYLGETALVLDRPRTADVTALTAVEALALGRHAFLHLIRGTGLEQRLAGLARQRQRSSWELLGRHPILGSLTPNQKNQLELCMSPLELEAGAGLGERPALVEEGQLELVAASGAAGCRVGVAELALDPAAVMRGTPWGIGFRACSRVTGYVLDRDQFRGFLRNNPGVYLQLLGLAAGWSRPVEQAHGRTGTEAGPAGS
jgi:CRP-like cAMP-binding protein